AQPLPRPLPRFRPRDPLGAVLVSRQLLELAKLGNGAVRLKSHARSLIPGGGAFQSENVAPPDKPPDAMPRGQSLKHFVHKEKCGPTAESDVVEARNRRTTPRKPCPGDCPLNVSSTDRPRQRDRAPGTQGRRVDPGQHLQRQRVARADG